MSNYNKATNFAVKDTLTSGDPDKIVSGAEIDNEFNSIASSSSTKIDKVTNGVAGNLPRITSTGNLEDSGQDADTIVPVATILMYGGGTAPNGWLFCDGSAQLRTSFPELFSEIGTSFGEGDGNTTFNLPDLRDRFPLGQGAMGGTDAGLIDLFDTGVGDANGEAEQFLSVPQLPSHNHNIQLFEGGGGPINAFTQAIEGGPVASVESGTDIKNTGGGEGHNNIPPFLALNFIIKA
jgi:microcystin-dependent protein